MVAVILTVGLLAACGRSSLPGSSVSPATAAREATVRDGRARFTVLTPTLIRMEYADDERFENGATQTVINRRLPVPAYTTFVENGERVIRTSRLTLRWVQGSGGFRQETVTVEVDGAPALAHPSWNEDSNPPALPGWRRSLDNEQDPTVLHPGLISRAGWRLVDDTQTVLLVDAAPGFAQRPAHTGAYQDGYFFGYGLDYTQALSDLRAITGAAPLLPRKALGVWFSRYWSYSDAELRELVQRFHDEGVPLDVFSVDTDWKRVHNQLGCIPFALIAGARVGDPCSWNGWDWNRDAFPDPAALLAWMHEQGVEVGLNIHPSISNRDPQYAQTVAVTGPLAIDSALPPCTLFQADPTSLCYVFDWTQSAQLKAYFALHEPLGVGVDFWWLDWCCDGSKAEAPGLTADLFINAQYHADNVRRGSRWPAFSRIGSSFQEGKAGIANKGNGALAEHRHTLHFTGDACGTWQMLAHEAEFTAAEGAMGIPYVSHDIGSFLGPPTATGCNGTLGRTAHLPDDMYVRWLQFGVFQPLDRLHSHHGDRAPWDYPGAPEEIAKDFLRLRSRLVPYLYTLSREAHDTGLPIARALYLQWPQEEDAYTHASQYTLGRDMLVAPVVAAGDPAMQRVWIPPGTWTDYFTGESHAGPALVDLSVPLSRMPVLMRAGAILPTQPDVQTSAIGPQDGLTISVWPGADGAFELYDDEGKGFGYLNGAYSRTRIATTTSAAGCVSVVIGAARGSFPGALARRSWTVSLVGVDAPVVVKVNGANLSGAYDAATRSLSVQTGVQATDAALSVVAGPAGC